MENIDIAAVQQLTRVSRTKLRQLLKSESRQLELSKSLLNLLHNIIRVGSVPVSETQKRFFDKNANLVLKLLDRRQPLAWKKSQLERNAALVLNIASSCPVVAGLYSPSSITTS